MIKKKAKMIKKKPKLSKKPKMAKKPKLSKKPKMGHKKPKMGHKKPKLMNKPKVKKFSKSSTKRNLPKDTPERLQIKKTGRDLQNALIKEQNKPVAKQDKAYINNLKGAIEEQNKKLKPSMMKKPKIVYSGGTGSATMSAKEKLTAAKEAKRAPGKAVRDARKALREENKSTRKATRKSNKISRVTERLASKKKRVERRTNKTRVQDKLDKLNMPTMLKPMMGTGTMKPKIKKPMMMKKPMMGFRKKK